MTTDGVIQYGLSLALILFGGGSAVRYVLERRKAKAQGMVAESTAELQINATQLANIRSQMELMKAAWSAERTSLQGRITALAEELAEERKQSRARQAEKEAEIKVLREQVTRMQADLVDMSRRLAAMSDPDQKR